jgi:hypothetical protein
VITKLTKGRLKARFAAVRVRTADGLLAEVSQSKSERPKVSIWSGPGVGVGQKFAFAHAHRGSQKMCGNSEIWQVMYV